MRKSNLLQEDQLDMLLQLAQTCTKVVEHKTPRGMQDAEAVVVGLLQEAMQGYWRDGELVPFNLDALMQLLEYSRQPEGAGHVVSLMGKQLEGLQQLDIGLNEYSIISAVLNHSLTTCELVADYSTIQAIMDICLVIQVHASC